MSAAEGRGDAGGQCRVPLGGLANELFAVDLMSVGGRHARAEIVSPRRRLRGLNARCYAYTSLLEGRHEQTGREGA